ncbi:hypothetical protein Nepgr_023183 [Nepenthes gracilis]|uniref:Uncharacterized protein n=1 Tax=Nepenthes gracilis TaxID=150966 RepID=A0AAD3T2C3_NEPGR|nr:hypothetical protein Nepgr_023183 [Nepenthes gracilis]
MTRLSEPPTANENTAAATQKKPWPQGSTKPMQLHHSHRGLPKWQQIFSTISKEGTEPFRCPCSRITTQQGTSHRLYQQSISSKLHRNDQHHAAALNTTTTPAILQQWPLLPGVPPDQLPSQQRSNKAHGSKSSMCHMEISIQHKTTCQQLGDDTSSQST